MKVLYDLMIVTLIRFFSQDKISEVFSGSYNLVVKLANNKFLRFDRQFGRHIDQEWSLISRAREKIVEKELHLPGATKLKLFGISYISMPRYFDSLNTSRTTELINQYVLDGPNRSNDFEQVFPIDFMETAYLHLAASIESSLLELPQDWNTESLRQSSIFELRPSHGDLNIGNVFVNESGDSLIFIDLDCMNLTGIREFDFIDYTLSIDGNPGWINGLIEIVEQGKSQSLFKQSISQNESCRWLYFYLLHRIGQDYKKFGNDTLFKNPSKVICLVRVLLSKCA
jgi:hypothetical protein